MTYYKISEDELREFLYDSLKLAALENGGVDNWEWYGISIHEFEENNGELYELAKKKLENYPEVE